MKNRLTITDRLRKLDSAILNDQLMKFNQNNQYNMNAPQMCLADQKQATTSTSSTTHIKLTKWTRENQ